MAYEQSMIDAPITPAPVFAYRAIRGMFFGSPDDSPIATGARVGNETRTTTELSPTKGLPTTHTQLTTTPSQKRKRDSNNILSPTKSCLRTPGAVTPRRVMLRDLSVTFRVNGEGDNKENLQPRPTIASSVSQHPVSPTKNTRAFVPDPASQPAEKHSSSVVTAVAPNFDVETYMATTEKEMKKLIRYGQKMREYARKQDEENLKLRGLIEELRDENVRLKMGRHHDDRDKGIAQEKFHVPLPAKPDIQRSEDRASTRLLYSTKRLSKSPSQVTLDNSTTVGKSDTITTRSKDQQKTAVADLLNLDIYGRKSSKLKPERKSDRVSDSDAKFADEPRQSNKSHTIRQNATTRHSLTAHNSHPRSQPEPKVQPQHISTFNSDLQIHIPATTTNFLSQPQANNQTSTRLPSERMLAARARVKKKSELRKTSAESAGEAHEDRDVITHVETTRAPSAKVIKEMDSLVDWVGL